MEKEITIEDIREYKKTFNRSKHNHLAGLAVQKNGVLASCFNQEEAAKLKNVFNVEVKDMPSVTNQKQSGRCWMFASLNIIRPILCKKLGMKDFEPSEAYLMFYDKLEKCNLKLQLIIDNIELPYLAREKDAMRNVGGDFDGGYFHYFRELVKKYGICPKDCMKETQPSSASKEMDDVLKVLLSKDTTLLEDNYAEFHDVSRLMELKGSMMEEIYKVLAICIGVPVDSFTYEYKKEDGTYVRIESTPKKFFEEYVGMDLDNYVVLVSHDNPNYPYYENYQNEYSVNMACQQYKVLNVPLKELKESCIETLKANLPVWFACDVGAYCSRPDGILSTKVICLDELFQIDLSQNKFREVVNGASFWNHAMTLTGVNLDKNNLPERWKIQNSWGTDTGDKGIYIMSDEWYDRFVYEAVIPTEYLSPKALKASKKKANLLKPWDKVA